MADFYRDFGLRGARGRGGPRRGHGGPRRGVGRGDPPVNLTDFIGDLGLKGRWRGGPWRGGVGGGALPENLIDFNGDLGLKGGQDCPNPEGNPPKKAGGPLPHPALRHWVT